MTCSCDIVHQVSMYCVYHKYSRSWVAGVTPSTSFVHVVQDTQVMICSDCECTTVGMVVLLYQVANFWKSGCTNIGGRGVKGKILTNIAPVVGSLLHITHA